MQQVLLFLVLNSTQLWVNILLIQIFIGVWKIKIASLIQGLILFLQTNISVSLCLNHMFHTLKYPYTHTGYLKNNPNHGLLMKPEASFQLHNFYDSNLAVCLPTRHSISGFYIMLGQSPISRKSKKHNEVSISSVETEYMSIRRVCLELTWLTHCALFMNSLSHELSQFHWNTIAKLQLI